MMQVAGSWRQVATGGNLLSLCFDCKVAGVASVASQRARVRARNVFFTRVHRIVSRACIGGNTGNTGNFPVTMRVSEVATGGNLNHQAGNLGFQPMSKSLRQSMPTTAAFIDAMRDAFGADAINAQIKAGIAGQPTFWAKENGQEIGTRAPHSADRAVSLSDTIIGPMNTTAARSRKS